VSGARAEAAARELDAVRAVVRDENDEDVDALELARKRLKLPTLASVIRRAREDALYDFELEDGTILPVGPTLLDPRRVEAAIEGHTDGAPPYYSPAKFRPIANALHKIADLRDTGATASNETRAWLADFVGEQAARALVDVESPDALAEVLPYSAAFRGTDRRIYVHLPGLVRWVTRVYGARTTTRDLSARLARLGFESAQPSARVDGDRVVKRRLWVSPAGFDPTEEG
jgi:hypothetical protein